MSKLNELKRDVFFYLLDEVGRVFIHAQPSMDLEIGKRGLVGDELKEGITLVFNSKMKFEWGDYGIEVTLVFGTAPEKCFVPLEAIDAVYSPERNIQFTLEVDDEPVDDDKVDIKKKPAKKSAKPDVKSDGKLIQVDFRQKQ